MVIRLPVASWPAMPEAGCGTCTACCVIPGIPELGKPFYAKCVHVGEGCTIYSDRPQRCRDFRCIWHLGVLGERVDRRPDHCGVFFCLEPDGDKWYLGVYELVPEAARDEKIRYLTSVILASKHVRHLALGSPAIRIYPFGADIPVDYAISDDFDWEVITGMSPMRRQGSTGVFDGKCRGIIEPRHCGTAERHSTSFAQGTEPARPGPGSSTISETLHITDRRAEAIQSPTLGANPKFVSIVLTRPQE